jgi:hypothetical protein
MDITINDWSIWLEMTHLTILSNGTFSQVEPKKKDIPSQDGQKVSR